ncbi:hypothetical protein F949_01639 [Acinetobacter junii NIPH 182]|uniref:hypothetical protein n=1 Tax=Acinetobacter junii TaxID=40215 RepID=UPI0002D02316|nr:hypothetical protein [Acinetobacter junii]ENV64250.1 hypothetical protein F949_01639 [Acinetobacter junii NIPH 182]
MPDLNEERLKYLFNTPAIEVPHAEEGKKRTFKGTAYSGGRVDGHWYWGRTGVVFDLNGIEIDSPTALLEEHFGSSRIGVVKKVDTNGKIDVEGHFLTNDRAKEVVQDSDDEFPFQMSMYIDPGSVEEVNTGQTVIVNGQSFTGPIAVFRNNRIREFTICSTGADRNTSIKAFSSKANSNQQPVGSTDVTELEQLKADNQKLTTERDNAVNELKKFKADKRTSDISALETELKTQFNAEDKTAYTTMDDATFAFAAKQLRQFSVGGQSGQPAQQPAPANQPNPALAHLFTHQANGGAQGQGNNGNQEHQFSAGAKAFAAQNKGK